MSSESEIDEENNKAENDINTWRKLRSFPDPVSPAVLRRMSQGQWVSIAIFRTLDFDPFRKKNRLPAFRQTDPFLFFVL